MRRFPTTTKTPTKNKERTEGSLTATADRVKNVLEKNEKLESESICSIPPISERLISTVASNQLPIPKSPRLTPRANETSSGDWDVIAFELSRDPASKF